MNSTAPPGPLLFSPRESEAFARAVSRESGIALGALEDRVFEDGEFKLRPLETVRGRAVFVLQSLAASPDASSALRLIRLLFLLQGLRDAGAIRLTAVVPYLAYARKDRRTQPRDPVNTRYVAQLLEASSVDQLLALDVHNSAALDNAFRIPVDHLTALPMFACHFAVRLRSTDVTVVSPDVGGIKRAQIFREMMQGELGHEVGLAFVEKRRSGGIVSGGTVAGEVGGTVAIVLDDLCASGGTLIRAAQALRRAGASDVQVAVTHTAMASGTATVAADSGIGAIVVTDSVGPSMGIGSPPSDKLTVLSIAPLFGQALARMVRAAPLTPLLERWPVGVDA